MFVLPKSPSARVKNGFAVVVCLGAMIALGACGGSDNKASALATSDRLLTAADVQDIPVAREFKWTDAAGVRDEGLGTTTIQAAPADAFDAVTKAGFKSGAARVFERDEGTDRHAMVVVIALQLASDNGAKDVEAFSADDDEKPCPQTCAFEVTKTTPTGIPGARGIQRLATAANIAAVSDTETKPTEIHRIVFTDGGYFYYVQTVSPPDAGAAARALAFATTLYKRVKGAPAPAN